MDSLKQLEAVVGKSALRSLQRGGILHIWRRSSPHNWWVSAKRDMYKMYWHSGDSGYPDLHLFVKVKDSKERVTYGGFMRGSDEGKPEHSQYRLRKGL